MKPSVAIVGCGRVGTTLGYRLRTLGYPVSGISSRSQESIRRAAVLLETEHFSLNPWDITREADAIFITTPDDAIEETCSRIAANGGFPKNATVFHCSGSQPSTILSAATTCGALIGSMHPLQSFAGIETDRNPFEGIIMAVEGDEAAVFLATAMAEDLGSRCLSIRTDAKTLYHASAVVASNYLVTLADFAFQLLEKAGISERDAYDVLSPLIMGTLANIRQTGAKPALTGPIARGDTEIIKSHLREIGAQTPALLSLYRILGRHTVGIASFNESISPDITRELNEMLSLGLEEDG